MAKDEPMSDDFVASLLAKDAKTSNAKYSTYGLQELMPKRPTYSAPKPNTRFLKNIIKETDSHNAALRAKEAAESRARLRRLRNEDARIPGLEDNHGRLNRESDPNGHRAKRQRTDSETHSYGSYGRPSKSLGGDDYGRLSRESSQEDQRSKRRQVREEDDTSQDDERKKRRRRETSNSRSGRKCHRHLDSYHDSEEDRLRRSHHSHRRHHRKRHRTRSRSRSRDRSDGKRRHRRESHSPSKFKTHSSRSHKAHNRHHRSSRRSISRLSSLSPPQGEHQDVKSERSKPRKISKPADSTVKGEKDNAQSSASESDPLEAIIGPPPPPPPPKVQARGRGNFSSASAMDSHFSSTYDPSVDVQPDADVDDDWDMALEALRDRQKWQKQGAERLKAAGFTEEEVEKWEKGGEKTEEDVRWRRKGEGREWDRGKVVDEEGVETKSEWGRLKGT